MHFFFPSTTGKRSLPPPTPTYSTHPILFDSIPRRGNGTPKVFQLVYGPNQRWVHWSVLKKSDRWIDHTFDGWLRPKGCTKKELPETPPSLRPEGFKYRYLEVDSLQRYHIINLPHLNQLRVSPSDIPMGASKKSSIRTSGDKAKL